MRILRNDGISIVALVIALLLLSTLGTVLTSLIITKQKSALLPLKSAQAFYAAQAGIEYAIRYVNDNKAAFWTDPVSIFPIPLNNPPISVGAGSFNVTYDATNRIITSTGTAGTATRKITLASFPAYVAGGDIILDPNPSNPPTQNQKICTIPILISADNIYIFQIDIAKVAAKKSMCTKLEIGSTQVWAGSTEIVESAVIAGMQYFSFRFTAIPSPPTKPPIVVNFIMTLQAAAGALDEWYFIFHYSTVPVVLPDIPTEDKTSSVKKVVLTPIK